MFGQYRCYWACKLNLSLNLIMILNPSACVYNNNRNRNVNKNRNYYHSKHLQLSADAVRRRAHHAMAEVCHVHDSWSLHAESCQWNQWCASSMWTSRPERERAGEPGSLDSNESCWRSVFFNVSGEQELSPASETPPVLPWGRQRVITT